MADALNVKPFIPVSPRYIGASDCWYEWNLGRLLLSIMKQSKRSILLVFTLLLAAISGANESKALSDKRILVLYSYGRLMPVDVEVDHGLDTVLEQEGMGGTRRSTEFLDSPEFHGE